METPKFYVTPQEFADVVVLAMEEIGYFKKDQKAHPEDIQIAFETVSKGIALGMEFVGRKIR